MNLNEILDNIAEEALASGDQAILDLIEEADELVNGDDDHRYNPAQFCAKCGGPCTIGSKPYVIERMNNLIVALEEVGEHLRDDDNAGHDALANADGIAGEILTMIDGR